MNAFLSSITRKCVVIGTVAIAFGVAAGAALMSTGTETAADSGLSPGFIKGTVPPKPDPAMIEAHSIPVPVADRTFRLNSAFSGFTSCDATSGPR